MEPYTLRVYKVFTKTSRGPWLRRDCLVPAGIINCTPPSALPFWVSLFPGMCGYNTLTTWCEELTHWKRPWCWERLRAGGEVGDRGWDGWMASPTQWTWVWANSGRWWRTGKPGVLQSMGSQRVRHDWVTEQRLGWADFQLWVGPGRLYVSLTLLSLATDYPGCLHGESCG